MLKQTNFFSFETPKLTQIWRHSLNRSNVCNTMIIDQYYIDNIAHIIQGNVPACHLNYVLTSGLTTLL